LLPRNGLADGFNFIFDIIPEAWRPFWMEAWVNPEHSGLQQLRDMVPESSYVKNNVIEAVTSIYRKKVGEQIIKEVIAAPIADKKMAATTATVKVTVVDIYDYYKVTERVTRFDPKVPLGFITAQDNNTIRLHEDAKSIYNKIASAAEFFHDIETAHIVKSCLIIGLISGSTVYALEAARAKILLQNIDHELNILKGSEANDGLVALENQYIPSTARTINEIKAGVPETIMRNPILGGHRNGYAEFPLNNHANIIKEEETFLEARRMIDQSFQIRINQGFR
jgi:hypothetical protein